MQVFKFGGASVRDAESVRNVGRILAMHNTKSLVVVVSAMGKTTNALEDVVNTYWARHNYADKLAVVRQYHYQIITDLFDTRANLVWSQIETLINEIDDYLQESTSTDYDMVYDQVVSCGELMSTKIVSAYLNENSYPNQWLDVREYVVTDNLYREARVDWEGTVAGISAKISKMASQKAVITQGFIGRASDGSTTTLGREGSDFTASVFAYALNADKLVIWKDVPGILNADPKKFPGSVKFDTLSYQDAVEMTYYGATVLHPKTIKPLQNKNIPLHVRSFIDPGAAGTIISVDIPENKDIPIIILKEKQILVSLCAKDYSFIAEDNIEKIFDEVVRFGIKVNVMSNSAISFSICIDERGQGLDDFMDILKEEFIISVTKGLHLLTVKYHSEKMLSELLAGKTIMLELRSGSTVQYVLQNK